MIDLFFDRVQRHGDRLAIVDHDRSITYSQLAGQVHSSATWFANTVGPGRCIALELRASSQLIVFWLASLSADVSAFATIDPINPAARRERMRQLSLANVAMGHDGWSARETDARVPDGTRYVFFSSGSSGEPKAVFMPSTGLRNVVEAQIERFRLGPESEVFWFLSPGFDASFSDVFTALCSGATIHIDRAARDSMAQLSEVFRTRKITHVDLPPSLLSYLEPEHLPTLETIVIGGEVATQSVVDTWGDAVRLVNCYGPTEATVCTSMKVLEPGDDPTNIGSPIPNVGYRIVDDELLIQSPGIAIGYADNLYEERFIDGEEGRWFRTGDRVAKVAGEYRFLGRLDRQFKLRSMLVSPEEIEHVVLSNGAVTECHVCDLDGQLVCFYGGESPVQLRARCEERLAPWMVPTRFEYLEEGLPRGTNGKVDPSQLTLRRVGDATSNLELGQPALAAIVEILSSVLGVAIGPSDDFFECGGDSMMAMEAVALAASLGVPISTEAITAHRTPDEIERSFGSQPTWTVDEIRDAVRQRKPRIKHGGVPGPVEHILVTGGNGFLGTQVVRRLVDEGYRVTCIVRGRSEEHAREKMGDLAGAVDVVHGDVSKQQGDSIDIAQNTYQRLVDTIDTIVHLAANVNLSAPFDLELAHRIAANVHMLQHQKKPKRLVLASSLSVFVSTDGASRQVRESDEPDGSVFSGYACEKVFADIYARECTTLPLSLIRYGLLTGDSMTGASHAKNVFSSFIRAILELEMSPRSETLRFDVTPIDYAADATVALVKNADHARHEQQIFHLANPTSVSLTELVAAIESVTGMQIATCTPSEFRRSVLTRSIHPEATLGILAASRMYHPASALPTRPFDLFLASANELNSPETDSRLASLGVTRDVENEVLLRRYVARVMEMR